MRAFFSYGVAFLIILAAGAWLSTGLLVQGGQGPGKGERHIVELVDGGKDGPVKTALENSGMLSESENHSDIDPHLTIAQRQQAAKGSADEARSVRIETFTAKDMPIEVPLRGQTRAKATVTASAETTGIVSAVAVTKGQSVKTGDLLCTLDQGTRQTAVAQAEATLAQAQSAYNSTKTLVEKGSAASNALLGVEASLKGAQAAVDQAKAELERTEIRAKSDGVVQDPLANVGAMLAAGSPCATIVQMNPIVFTINVPEARIGYARLGLPATVSTVTGKTAQGKVSYIASVADAATRSFPIEIEIPNADGSLQAGLTASATVNLGSTSAQLLPQSVLTLDDDGTLGVRAVENSKVTFYPVTIVSDTREGVLVTGLPAKLDVITVGQEFVQAGQTVNAAKADGA